MPIGTQLMTPYFEEQKLLAIAAQLESKLSESES